MTQFTLVVNTTGDQNDGSADNGLSLRDAIMIANSDPIANDYKIVLTNGAAYQLTAVNLSTDSDRGGDLDIYAKGQVTITTDGNQRAIIAASNLTTGDRVIEVGVRRGNEVLANGNLILENTVITGGSDDSIYHGGGGIYIGPGSTGILNSVIVSENCSSEQGGGIANRGTLLLVASVVRNNSVSGGRGGGINNYGTLTILDSRINDNYARVDGGGISTGGDEAVVTIINSTINHNSSFDGGGISNSSTLSLTNVTVSSNTATSEGGGGISLSGGTSSIVNSTITNNTSLPFLSSDETNSGGIDNSLGSLLKLRNTIVAGNTAEVGDDLRNWLGGIVDDDGSNLIGKRLNGQDSIRGTEIDNNIDAKLGPLQNNGGLNSTHALLEGSPAINTGNNANIAADSLDIDNDGDTTELIPYDERGSGYPRIYGNAIDIGAVEFQPPPPSVSISNFATTTDDLANSNAVFTVTLSYASGSPISVQYTTQGAGSDYIPTSGTLTFSPGQTALNIAVPIITDTVVEPDELFFVTLSNPTNATISNFIGTAIITNIDPAEYGASNPDLIPVFGYNLDAFRNHYYSNGINEGRSTNSFEPYRYVASNADLIPVFGLNTAAATQHYITSGYTEGRSTTSFDPARYLDSYDDLLGVYGINTLGVTQHYITNGYTEGRNPNLFPSDRYIASHGDLIQAFSYNLEAGSNHYLYSGRNEGRQVTFDPFSYMAFNGDVAAAYGNNPILATEHYIEHGYGEGRRVT